MAEALLSLLSQEVQPGANHTLNGKQAPTQAPANMTTTKPKPLVISEALGPLLPALPAAAASSQPPPDEILAVLSPILRQRVQFLSAGASDPWIGLLCYDESKAASLQELVAQGGRLEPHPVSGEIEVDWDYDSEARYRRLDQETLEAFVVLEDFGLAFKLVYCIGGESDGWRVGEVTTADKPSPLSSFGGVSSIDEAERQFRESAGAAANGAKSATATGAAPTAAEQQNGGDAKEGGDDDDDDDYWNQYDNAPSETPAQKASPGPAAMKNGYSAPAVEEDYYAQYDSVQPALDNYDPDEDMTGGGAEIAPPLGLGTGPAASSTAAMNGNNHQLNGGATAAAPDGLLHPQPERPPSSADSRTSVERLEGAAQKQEQNEFGVKQHVSRSIKSLYMLARSSGIDLEEFERIVKTELDTLGMMGDG